MTCYDVPSSVVALNLRRATMYPLNFMITYGPIQVFWMMENYYAYDLLEMQSTRMLFACPSFILQGLNGVFNTITYFSQSRYANHHDWLQRRYNGSAVDSSSARAGTSETEGRASCASESGDSRPIRGASADRVNLSFHVEFLDTLVHEIERTADSTTELTPRLG